MFCNADKALSMSDEAAEEDLLVDHPRYRKISDLNRGSFGFVILAQDVRVGERVAIKLLPRGPRINTNVEREILNHKNLLHHHVIQFKGVFLTARYLAIVMEYAEGGDLVEYIRQRRGLSEDMVRWFFQQLIIGLDYCHRMGVANRDIKLENTLLNDNDWPLLKICDFGFSKHVDKDSVPTTVVGTRPYLAPEVILRENRGDPYDGKKADIWSCGVFLYVMLVRRFPFVRQGENPRLHNAIILDRLRRLDYEIPRGSMSDDCSDLIQKILVLNPEDRFSIEDIQNHAWYQTSLPSGAMDMNWKLEEQRDLQSVEEIQALVDEARVPFQ